MTDKSFVVKNGLVVNNSLLVANSSNRRVSVNDLNQEADFTVKGTDITNVLTVSIANSTSDVIQTSTSHGYTNGQAIFVRSSSAVPVGITNTNIYFVNVRSANTLTLHQTYNNALNGTSNVDIQNSGSGTITIHPISIGLSYYSNNANLSTIRFIQYRGANGSNWYTAPARIQMATDDVAQAYIEFNPNSAPGGLAIGFSTGEGLRMLANGQATIYANTNITGTLGVANTFNVNGAVSFSNTLIVVGALTIGNSTVNNVITSTSFSGSSNNTTYLNGKSESALNVNNAVYLNGQTSAYYTNATNLTTGTIPSARILGANTTTAGIVQLIDSVSNTSISLALAANVGKTIYDYANNASLKADNAYSNSVLYINSNIATANDFLIKPEDPSTGKLIATNTIFNSTSLVTLNSTNSTSNTITINLNTGINFEVTLGSNSTLANPSNGKTGFAGFIRIIQDATGSRTLSFGTTWKFADGTDPTVSTTANASDFLYYSCVSNTYIIGNLIRNVS